jgi:uroporphyrinogen decarboxylase
MSESKQKEREKEATVTNDLLIRAALGQYTEYTPIWVHRQAGRYLVILQLLFLLHLYFTSVCFFQPEYKEVTSKSGKDFFGYVRDPELVLTVTLQPVERMPLDAAIIFSDILVIPQALGLTVEMKKGEGPVVPEPLIDPSHMKRLTHASKLNIDKELVRSFVRSFVRWFIVCLFVCARTSSFCLSFLGIRL